MIKSFSIIALVLLIASAVINNRANAQEFDFDVTSQPVELGQVEWIRDFDRGVDTAKAQKKPLLVLFQEVPGCSTASGYGKNVLSHPLIVEAIETLFVPVAVYNNTGGEDRKVLDSFGEPSWNNPVVRIMTPERKELTPRLSGNYTKAGLVNSMVSALKNSNRDVPQYLSLLQAELHAKAGKNERAVFAMHCFWTGEAKLGNIKGVTTTKPGFMGGYEVVELEYNPSIISYEDLVSRAKSNKVASHVFTVNDIQNTAAKELLGAEEVSVATTFRPDRSPKYYLSRTSYKHVPMTELQKSRVNAAIGSLQSPDTYLSPKQLQLFGYITEHKEINWPNLIDAGNFESSWEKTVSTASSRVSLR